MKIVKIYSDSRLAFYFAKYYSLWCPDKDQFRSVEALLALQQSDNKLRNTLFLKPEGFFFSFISNLNKSSKP